MDFLENPRKLWRFGSFKHKSAVLKLAFEGGACLRPRKRFSNCRNLLPYKGFEELLYRKIRNGAQGRN